MLLSHATGARQAFADQIRSVGGFGHTSSSAVLPRLCLRLAKCLLPLSMASHHQPATLAPAPEMLDSRCHPSAIQIFFGNLPPPAGPDLPRARRGPGRFFEGRRHRLLLIMVGGAAEYKYEQYRVYGTCATMDLAWSALSLIIAKSGPTTQQPMTLRLCLSKGILRMAIECPQRVVDPIRRTSGQELFGFWRRYRARSRDTCAQGFFLQDDHKSQQCRVK